MSVTPDYQVIRQVHIAKWNPALQQSVEGWEITVRDAITGTVAPVFVDDDHYTVDGTRQLIEAALAPVRQIAQLGRASSPGGSSGG